MRTLAIIPAYNEEASIEATVEELKAVAPEVDYVVINDGSRDGTARICRERGYNLISLPVNLGLTCGFATGMKYALAHGYDCAIQFDADGQHMPQYIAPMVERMEQTGADIVIGSRFVTKKKDSSTRMVGSRLLVGLIKLTTGTRVADPTSGMRLFNRSMIEVFATKADFGPEPDAIAYLIRHGAKVSEVQVEMRDRSAGESYLSPIRSIKYMARVCVSILLLQWFR